MASLTFALVAVFVVAMASATTRPVGLLCIALLVCLHPNFFAALLLIAGVACLYINWRNR